LFQRGAGGVTLTVAGVQLLRDAQGILAGLDRVRANVGAAESGRTGTLVVGFTMCAAYSVIPTLIRSFGAQYPDVSLTLREVVSNDLLPRLLDGRVDVAVMLPAALAPGLAQRTLLVEPLCMALPAAYPATPGRAPALADLAHCSFIASTDEAAPGLRRTIEAQCAAAGFTPRIGIEVQLQQTILSLVAEGFGVALVPASMQKMGGEGIRFHRLDNALSVEQVLVWSATASNPCVQNLLDLCSDWSPQRAPMSKCSATMSCLR
jgi:DNA-binding transcriptional LysR family regulator